MIDAAREVIPQAFALALVLALALAGAHYGPRIRRWWQEVQGPLP